MGFYAETRRNAWNRLRELESKSVLSDTEARELANMLAILAMQHGDR